MKQIIRIIFRCLTPFANGLIITIIISCTVLTWREVLRTNSELRKDFLRQTQLVAETINLNYVKALSGTSADLEKPEYLRLKQQFASLVNNSNKYRFIYIMGLREDGRLFFLVDNNPAGSEKESPAGMVYDDAPAGFLRAIKTGLAVIEGPYSDRWGIFVSGCVPLIKEDKTIAIMAVDFDAGDWFVDIVCGAAVPLLLMFVLIGIVFAGKSLRQYRAKSSADVPRWMQYVESVIVAAVGLALTVFAAWTFHRYEHYDRCEIFSQLAASRTWSIAETMRILRDIELEGLARFFEGSDEVTYEEFYNYTGYLINNTAIQAWSWIPAVPLSDKSSYEEAARTGLFNGFRIWQENGPGSYNPVSERDIYYPVLLAVPIEGNQHAFGYDLGSEPLRRKALEEAARTGLITASDPICLVKEAECQHGILIFRPVFDMDRPQILQGFTMSLLRVSRLIEYTEPAISAIKINIAILHPNGGLEYLSDIIDDGSASYNEFQLMRPVLTFNQAFAVTAYPDQTFMRLYPVRAGWLTLLIGLLFTAVLAFITRMILHRRIVLEQMVAERTAKLHESEALLRIAGRTVCFGGWRADLETKKIIWSEQVAVIHAKEPGYSPSMDEAIQFLAPEWREKISIAFRHCVRDGINFDEEIEIITTDNRRLWVRMTGEPIRNNAGKIIRIQGAFQDINKRRQAEEERERLQTQLYNSRKMESIGRLAGGVAHDFNNILSIIIGYTEAAMDKINPENPLFNNLMEIYKAAERSAGITRQLLGFARKQMVAPTVMDLNITIKSMLDMLRRLIGEHIKLVWLPGKNLNPIKMDPSQIDQIMVTLCLNSRDAIENDGTITIETKNSSLDQTCCASYPDFVPGEYVLLIIKDNGCGMDNQTLSNIFEPFFTTKEVGKGTGLGLANIYGIVKQNNGFINVYSEPGQGAIFTICLPSFINKNQEEPLQQQQTAKSKPAPKDKGTILVIEEDPLILDMVTIMLNNLGYSVISASLPSKCLRLAENHHGKIDMLMTDIIIPEMNLRDITEQILSLQPDIKFLLISGYTSNVTIRQGVMEHDFHFIQKPFSLKELADKIKEVLEHGQRPCPQEDGVSCA